MKKIKIALLIVVLGITPFFKGCDFTFGFPLSVAELKFDYSHFRLTNPHLNFNVLTIFSFLFNISLGYLLILISVRIIKNKYLILAFARSIVLNIIFAWCCLAFILISEKPGVELDNVFGNGLKFLMQVIFYYLYYIPIVIREFTLKFFNIDSDSLLNVLSKIWFAVIVLLLGYLFFVISRFKTKRQLKP